MPNWELFNSMKLLLFRVKRMYIMHLTALRIRYNVRTGCIRCWLGFGWDALYIKCSRICLVIDPNVPPWGETGCNLVLKYNNMKRSVKIQDTCSIQPTLQLCTSVRKKIHSAHIPLPLHWEDAFALHLRMCARVRRCRCVRVFVCAFPTWFMWFFVPWISSFFITQNRRHDI